LANAWLADGGVCELLGLLNKLVLVGV
jgi:hypothetical protein